MVRIAAQAIWLSWLVSIVLLESRGTEARFGAVIVLGALMLALIPISLVLAVVPRRLVQWRDLAIAPITLGLLVIGILVFFMWDARPPTHAALLARFDAHRDAYVSLRDMMRADHLANVRNYGSGKVYAKEPLPIGFENFPKYVGLSPNRAYDYQQLMWEADCEHIERLEDGAVLFSMSGPGIRGGWGIALVSTPTTPERLVPTIDSFLNATSSWKEAYSPLADTWYLRIRRH